MIEVKQLSKAYDKVLFQDISLTFENAEAYVITGANGSGKSTFLRCLSGFEKADTGSFRIEGNLLYQPQEAMLFKLSCYENVIIGNRKADKNHVQQLFEQLGIGELLYRNVRGLSGGERQKVTLIRSLLTGGKALLLDEPFSALDEISTRICLQLLKNYAKRYEATLLFVSHDIHASSQIADYRYHLENGKFQLIKGNRKIGA